MTEKNSFPQSNEKKIIKPPVVVVLGHIDHGKTTLLDFIRKTRVAEKESGGITQHIGAYEIIYQNKKITFIDTPGHEAFSQIRSRGAKVADIAILVIDATEGLKTQTKEAINLIKKANIPFVVAINKIDKVGADPEKVKRDLIKEEILVEELGGEVPAISISAKTGQGVNDLLEIILLLAEMEKLETRLDTPAQGVIIECCIESKRGVVATLILNEGILKIGQIVGTNSTFGKIKLLEDFQGNPIKEAFPGQPVLLLGLEKVPIVGEVLKVFSSIEEAQLNIKKELSKKENYEKEVIFVGENQKVLNIILKADVLSSVEAIEEILKSLPKENIVLRILKREVGEVVENDIKLAIQAKAAILAFRTKVNLIAETLAEREKIKIFRFEVIYDLIETIRKYIEKLLEPEIIRSDLAKIKTLIVFLTEKNRQIVGGRVLEGEVKKGLLVEVKRGEEIIGRGKLINLQRDKKDIEKAGKGEEVGLLYEGDVKIEEGDILIIYNQEKRKIKLEN